MEEVHSWDPAVTGPLSSGHSEFPYVSSAAISSPASTPASSRGQAMGKDKGSV